MKSVAFLSILVRSLELAIAVVLLSNPNASRAGANEGRRPRDLTPLKEVPWYDAERDELRAIKIPLPDTPPPVGSWTRATNPDIRPPTISASWLLWLIQIVGWSLLGVCLAAVIVAVLQRIRHPSVSPSTRTATIEPRIRIDALPPHIPRTKRSLWEEAQDCYERGDLGWAIVFLYGYQLVELDRCGYLRLTKGKTNRQYVRELARIPEMQTLLQRTSRLSEAFYFGTHVPTSDQFHSCWKEIDDFRTWTATGQLKSLVKQC